MGLSSASSTCRLDRAAGAADPVPTTAIIFCRLTGSVGLAPADRPGAIPNRAVKWNVLPRPASLSTRIAPPIRSTSREQIASPSPVPPYLRVVEPSACRNASKINLLFLGRNADAGVANRETQQDRAVRPATRSSTVHRYAARCA